MKTVLRSCFTLIGVIFLYGFSFAQGPAISSSLHNTTNLKVGDALNFTVTLTQGSAAANTQVKARIILNNIDFLGKLTEIDLEYQENGTWKKLSFNTNGEAAFGPANGFALTNTAIPFRGKINAASEYAYTLELTPAAGGDPVATKDEFVKIEAVNEPTLTSTIETIENLKSGEDIIYNIYLNSGDRIGDLVKLQLELALPYWRNNLTGMYALNPDGPNGVQYKPITFDAENKVVLLGTDDFIPLAKGETRIQLKFNFKTDGIYKHFLQLVRQDGNTIASRGEVANIGNVAGVKNNMIENTRITVAPTLSEGFVSIDLGAVRNASVHVADVVGKTVMQLGKVTGAVKLETSHLARGTYFVKVVKGRQLAVSRFVVR